MLNKRKDAHVKNLTRRRLYFLRKMFSDMDVDICGNIQYPSLIFDTNKLVYTNITNFKLRFLVDKPATGYNPETIYEINISDRKISKADEIKLLSIFNKYHSVVKVIKHQNTNLFLTGYNVVTLDSDKKRILSPVFGLINRKYYLNIENAESVMNLFNNLPLITI